MMCECRVWYDRFRIHEHPPAPGVVLVRGTHPGTWIRAALEVNLRWALWEGKLKWFLLPNIKNGKDYDPYRIGEVRIPSKNEYPHKVQIGDFANFIEDKVISRLSKLGGEAVKEAVEKRGSLADFHARATELIFSKLLEVQISLPIWIPIDPPPELKDNHGNFSSPWVIYQLAIQGFKAHAAGTGMAEYLKTFQWGFRYASAISIYERYFGVGVGVIDIYPPPEIKWEASFKGLPTQYTILSLKRG